MKNFTNLFKHKTNPLWIRLLIMVFMLIGANTAWSAYYAVGPAVGGWNTWVELKTTDNNKYTCAASPGEFKITNQNGAWGLDKNWDNVVGGTGVTKYNNNGNNASLQSGYNQICFYPSGNSNNGWLEGEKVSITATAYVVGGYYGGNDINYSSGKKLTKQSDGTYSGTFDNLSGDCYFQVFDDVSRVWGCDYTEKNVGESVTLSTSKADKVRYSLVYGTSYIFSFDPSDGTFSVKTSCTDPKAADFSYADPEPTYDGTAKSATVKWKDDNTSTGITVKYGGSTTAPTNAGTYAITVSTTAHGNICASKSDISLGDFTINKATQTALSISTAADVCGKSVTLATSGGTGTGSVTYSISGTNNIGASISATTLSATSSGSVNVKATKSGGTNYNDATVEKTFNFTMPIENVTLTKVDDGKTTYCVGDRAEFKLTYSGPYPTSYEWSGSAMGSLEATGKTAKVLDNGASWYIDFTEAKTYTISLSLTGCNTDNSDVLSFEVNSIPTAPTFTSNEATVCSGVAFNLNEKFTRNTGEAGNLTWYKSSDDSQVTDPASVTITEATSYYAKATNNNCTSDKSLNCTVNVDTKPILELASTPTVCPNVEIDLDNYVTSNTGTLTWYSNQERTTVITDGLVTPTEQTTYYAKVINGTCTPVEKEFTVNVYGIADDMPAYTSTPATSCKGTPNSDGTITLKNAVGGVTYALDGTNGTEWSGLAAGTHTLSALVDACPSLTKVWDVVVEVEYITPTATVSITGESSFCEGDNTELKCEVETTGVVTAYQWYNGDNPIQAATESTYTAKAAGTYKVVVTVENKGCEDTFNATKEVSVKNKPTTPEFTPDFTSICVGGSTTLASGYNWYTELNASALVDLTVSPQTTTTYYATKVENGCTSDAGEFTVTVNPLPTITEISGNNSAVLYEDVELTATGENIANVVWTADKGTITKDATDPKKAVLTYDQTGTVTVNATAISEDGCTSTAATKTVKFGEEECETETITTNSTKIEICVTGTNGATDVRCYAWYWNGSKNVELFGGWPGNENYTTETYNGKTYRKWSYDMGNLSNEVWIKFSNNGGNQTSDIDNNMYKNNKYYYTYDKGNSSYSKNGSASLATSTTTTIITTPAVKMLSAFSEEGSGELSMTAQIVKTGCNGNMTYYFKYRLKGDQAWSQTTPQTATGLKAGDEINETVSGLDQGGTYEIQAVINNNNEAVSNILEYVVNIQETEISDVTLQFADEDGNVLQNQNQIYCVGSTAYIKLSYDGTAHKSLEWIAENELQPVNGEDKLFSYVVRGDETITANVANNENKGTPATGTIDINVYTIATTPDISIDRTEVCSTDPVGAKITVKAPQEGITYRAYKMVDDVETPHGDAVVADNAESIIINSIKETGTYYVKAWNAQCLDAIAVSLSKFAVTKIDASSNTIAISPVSASTNPWMPVTVKVDKNSAYDYTLVCKQGNTDVTDQMVINKKGDSYVIKFPKPESAEIDKDGQVVFDDITYNVVATLNGDVQCGTTSATSTVTLTNLIEDCD